VSIDTAGALGLAARHVDGSVEFDELVRPILDALQRASGYESTYLTLIHWDEDRQEILLSQNIGDLRIEEGLTVEWSDTLCRRALTGGPSIVEDAGITYPDSGAARDLGIAGYASVPVQTADGETVGTLCGASTRRVVIDQATQDLFTAFSVLIGAAMSRERELIAQRVRTSFAEDRLRTRLESIAAAEHMLKTPLTALQGWATVLERKGEALTVEQRQRGLQAIGQSVTTLRTLVDRLLAATKDDYRLDSGLHLRVFDLHHALQQIVTAHEAAARGQTWTSTIPEGLFARVDPAGFEQLVSHLLDNAIKYGGPQARVEVTAAIDADGAVTLVIADTGPGMPEDLELFQPFAQSADSERSDSSGIGLHVVKTLADAHHATIDYSANSPHGTVVTVRFPAL
jgi:signal transduction histidine kinase